MPKLAGGAQCLQCTMTLAQQPAASLPLISPKYVLASVPLLLQEEMSRMSPIWPLADNRCACPQHRAGPGEICPGWATHREEAAGVRPGGRLALLQPGHQPPLLQLPGCRGQTAPISRMCPGASACPQSLSTVHVPGHSLSAIGTYMQRLALHCSCWQPTSLKRPTVRQPPSRLPAPCR